MIPDSRVCTTKVLLAEWMPITSQSLSLTSMYFNNLLDILHIFP